MADGANAFEARPVSAKAGFAAPAVGRMPDRMQYGVRGKVDDPKGAHRMAAEFCTCRDKTCPLNAGPGGRAGGGCIGKADKRPGKRIDKILDRAANMLRGSVFIGILPKKYAAPLDLPPAGGYRIRATAKEDGAGPSHRAGGAELCKGFWKARRLPLRPAPHRK